MKPNKILVAPTAFKGSLAAVEVAETIANKLKKILGEEKYEIVSLPVSDGGDGFLETLAGVFPVEFLEYEIALPYDFDKKFLTKVAYAKDRKTLYVESAKVIGLQITPREKRNPLFLNSYGLGELLKKIRDEKRSEKLDVEKVVLGLGGTATHDAGLGMASAFGLRILRCGKTLPVMPKFYGHADGVRYVKENFALGFELEAIADVRTDLIGENGSVKLFAVQKGADDYGISVLEKGIRKILRLTGAAKQQENAGAAGGTAFAVKFFFGGKITLASDFIADVYLQSHSDANFVITGEGKLDAQTLEGKAPFSVYNFFKRKNAEVIFIAGKNEIENSKDFRIFETSNYYDNFEQSINEPHKGIEKATELAAKIITEKNYG